MTMSDGRVSAEEIVESLGWNAKTKRIHLMTNYDAFILNSKDLISTINLIESKDVPSDVRGQHAFDLEGRAWVYNEVHLPVFRALSNYLSSAFALRDCTYKIASFILETLGNSDIRARATEAFSDNPTRAFLQDLRDMFMHSGGYNPTFMLKYNALEDGAIRTDKILCFKKRSMLCEGDWSEQSRQCIETWNEEVELADIVSQYTTDVATYYDWLFRHYDEIFAESFRQADDLIARWRS